MQEMGFEEKTPCFFELRAENSSLSALIKGGVFILVDDIDNFILMFMPVEEVNFGHVDKFLRNEIIKDFHPAMFPDSRSRVFKKPKAWFVFGYPAMPYSFESGYLFNSNPHQPWGYKEFHFPQFQHRLNSQ